jgi:type VI secretion system secreted protein VgrG
MNLQRVSMRLRLLTAKTPNKTLGVSDGSYSVLEFKGISKLNAPYEYTVTFISDEKLPLDKLADTDAMVLAKDENNPVRKRNIYGKVFKIEESSVVAKKHLYVMTLVSPFYYLRFNKRYKVYQEMSVPEIIEQVIKVTNPILGLEVESKLDPQSFPKRETCTQYNQSDAEFILMLAQEEKFAVSFISDNNAPYKIVLSNINEHAKKLDEAVPGTFNRAKYFTPTYHKENFYDFESPSLDYTTENGVKAEPQEIKDNDESSKLRNELTVQSIRDRLELMEGSRSKDLTRYTKFDAAAAYSPAEVMNGSSESLFVDAGLFASLAEKHTTSKADVILTSAKIEAIFPNALDEYADTKREYAFNVDFEAISATTPYIPDTKIVKPLISGVQTAIVSGGTSDTSSGENTIDVDELGRIRVIFHFDEEKPTSSYVRLGTIYSGNDWGAQFLPRVNSEVIVSFINGDIDRPIIVGALYNGNNSIPHSPAASKTCSYIKTQSTPGGGGYNELLFEDKSGEELLSLRGQKDYKLHALNDSTINIDHDQNATVGNDETINIVHDRTETVGNDETLSVVNNQTKSVGNMQTVTVGADQSVSVGSNQTTTVASNQTISVGSNLTTSVASNESLNVGSNRSVNIGGNHTETVTQNKAETVAIAKALTIGAGYQTTVGGAKNVTVGLSSTEQVGVLKNIIAGSRFELQVGGSSLILNADGTIILKGTEIKIDGTKQVTVNGTMIELN